MILNNIKPFDETGIIFKYVLDSVNGTVSGIFSENIAESFTLGYRQSLDGRIRPSKFFLPKRWFRFGVHVVSWIQNATDGFLVTAGRYLPAMIVYYTVC